ncbi:MAG: 2-hydroxyacid dehydrogenase [Gammaproteobacteria bacterium]|nr:2-hydroxyacid dehydrogenase [Gammaproteobacteria bacterium]
MKTELLQLCPFSPYLEQGLAERHTVHRWDLIDDSDRFLDEHAESIRAVATGGHIGIPADLMARLPVLGVVAINGVGYDKVDTVEARRRGIRVGTTPGILTDDVADLAVGMIIGLLRNLPQAHAHVRDGHWPAGDMPLARKVSGRHFGILGLGNIGLATARRLAPFGQISYCSLQRKDVPYPYFASVRELAEACDVLVLAAAANASTAHIINREVLDALGPEGWLVNVSRGALVDEAALITALHEGRIAGAALDVYAQEPHVPQALREAPNVLLTPHIASATQETRRAMADMVLANLDAYFAGQPLPGGVV